MRIKEKSQVEPRVQAAAGQAFPETSYRLVMDTRSRLLRFHWNLNDSCLQLFCVVIIRPGNAPVFVRPANTNWGNNGAGNTLRICHGAQQIAAALCQSSLILLYLFAPSPPAQRVLFRYFRCMLRIWLCRGNSRKVKAKKITYFESHFYQEGRPTSGPRL